jgi:hypothetical protein
MPCETLSDSRKVADGVLGHAPQSLTGQRNIGESDSFVLGHLTNGQFHNLGSGDLKRSSGVLSQLGSQPVQELKRVRGQVTSVPDNVLRGFGNHNSSSVLRLAKLQQLLGDDCDQHMVEVLIFQGADIDVSGYSPRVCLGSYK